MGDTKQKLQMPMFFLKESWWQNPNEFGLFRYPRVLSRLRLRSQGVDTGVKDSTPESESESMGWSTPESTPVTPPRLRSRGRLFRKQTTLLSNMEPNILRPGPTLPYPVDPVRSVPVQCCWWTNIFGSRCTNIRNWSRRVFGLNPTYYGFRFG